MQPSSWNYPRAEGQGAKKEVCFAYKILVFHLFPFFLFINHGSMWPLWSKCEVFNYFSRNFTRSTMLKFWVKTLVNKKNFSLLIIINVELRFEPCMVNLIWKWGTKDPKKREDHLIFIKEVHSKKTSKKEKTSMFKCYNLLDSMEWGALICWGWFPIG
jgi:hypothetical protein